MDEERKFDPASERLRLLDITLESIGETTPSMRAQLIKEARYLISDLGAGSGNFDTPQEEAPSGLVDFQARLAEKQSKAKGKGRSRKAR